MEKNVLFPEESYAICGAVFEVHKILGTCCAEKVYGDALEIEFQNRGIPYVREAQLKVYYKNVPLKHDFYADFVCYGKIVVELKSTIDFEGKHVSQVINYLKATRHPLGILVNFHQTIVKPLRIPCDPDVNQ